MGERIPIPRAEGTAVRFQNTLQLRSVWRPLLASAVLLVQPLTAPAQTVTAPAAVDQPASIKWWHGALVLGGLTGLMLLDHPVQRFTQDHRGNGADDLAAGLRHFGQPEVYGTITLGLVGTGLISGNSEITRAGGRLAAALALAGATSTLGKVAFGRPRPSESLDVDGFKPFSGQDAMPSGHTTMAFALATSLADDIHRTWASVGLYTIATGVAWSRVNDNRHWLSDVAAGAVVGISSAKLLNGHWRIFNLRPPQFLLSRDQASIAWTVSF
jgi:membrane-associated phospholipid phosphatase